MAHEAGASESELDQFINVAVTESGCPGEQWALLALKAYGEIEDGITIDAEICCHDERAN